MPGKSEIQWCTDVWNPTTGCTRVSAGCDHCYAFTLHDRRHAAYVAGAKLPPQYARPFSEVQLMPERLAVPLRWREPRRIFVDSMADLFHADVPDAFIAQVFTTMALVPRHTFMILTKRPQRMQRLLRDERFQEEIGALGWPNPLTGAQRAGPTPWPLPNVWLGVSVENQEAAYRVDWLVRTPAAVRFLSCEPLIGPLDLAHWLPVPTDDSTPYWGADCDETGCQAPATFTRPGRQFPTMIRECRAHVERVDWVIVGGESGRDARPMHPDWARDLRDQCVEAGVPFFFKQWGEWTEVDGPRCQRLNQAAARTGTWMRRDGTLVPRRFDGPDRHSPYGTSIMARLGKHKTGRELDRQTWDQLPGEGS